MSDMDEIAKAVLLAYQERLRIVLQAFYDAYGTGGEVPEHLVGEAGALLYGDDE